VPEVPTDLPGHALVADGLGDLAAGRRTEAALVVAMAAPRLRALGYEVASSGSPMPSHDLYDLLSDADPAGAHGRYNALVRQVVSFARAAEHAASG
jgi:hypothetical protein